MYFKRVLKLCLGRNLEWAWASETASVSIIAVTLWDQGHLLQVLRQELGAKRHQKNLNQAQEEAVSWQIAKKKKKSKKNVKDKSSAAFFPSAPGKDLIRKGPNEKTIGDKTPRRILPVLAIKGADMKMVIKASLSLLYFVLAAYSRT